MAWDLSAGDAVFRGAGLECRFRIDRPDRGLHGLRIGEALWEETSILAVQPGRPGDGHVDGHAEHVVESYVRDADLIVRYAEIPGRDVDYKLQMTPRYFAELGWGVELRIHVQTQWLDSNPGLELVTVCSPTSSVRAWDPERGWCELNAMTAASGGSRHDRPSSPSDGSAGTLLRVRSGSSSKSYLQLVDPRDLAEPPRLRTGPNRIVSGLFPESLEKGVIRLGRAWGIWIDRDAENDAPQRFFELLAELPLPLTA